MHKKRKYQVFVSSTREDLKEERMDIVEEILKSDCIPAGMELWPPSGKTQWEIIKRVIDESDYYLLIIAGRYGSVTKNEKGEEVSFTEMEYDYALQIGKPILALINSAPDELPRNKTETSEIMKIKLDAFREKAKQGRMVGFWKSREEFRSAAIHAIENAKIDFPKGGWIRVKNVEAIKSSAISSTQFDYSGKWKSFFTDIDGQEKSDQYFLEYDAETCNLYGLVQRATPKSNKDYEWNCDGYVIGDNIVMVYWSLVGKTRLTCGAVCLRYAKHSEYIGSYLTYEYKQKRIIEVPIKVVKI